MNLKQLGILLTVVIVIGGAAWYFHNRQDRSFGSGSPEMGKKLLGNFAFNDVAHIAIKDGTNELNLVKKNDLWRVHERSDYPANFSQISEFLLKARDLKIVQSEDVGPSQLPRMGLASGQGSNAAVVVEFKDQAEKPVRTLLLGKKHLKKPSGPSQFGGEDSAGYPDGRYVKVGDGPSVALISDPLDNMEPKPDEWLNKDFFRIEKAKTIEVDFPVATNSWKLTRDTETADWKLADAKKGEELDSSKVSGVSSPFSSPNFSDVKPGRNLNESGTNRPTTVKISTFDNFDYTITLGAKTNDDYLTTVAVAAQLPKQRTPGKNEKAEDKARLDKEFADAQQKLADKLKQEQDYEHWTYSVPSWVVDPVLKQRGELLAEKKEEPKTTSGSAEKSTETNHVQFPTAAKN
jgi:hypothetical protein